MGTTVYNKKHKQKILNPVRRNFSVYSFPRNYNFPIGYHHTKFKNHLKLYIVLEISVLAVHVYVMNLVHEIAEHAEHVYIMYIVQEIPIPAENVYIMYIVQEIPVPAMTQARSLMRLNLSGINQKKKITKVF